MGPGATDKWLAAGADPKKLPKETQGYIRGVNLAKGGEIRYFQAGGFGTEFGDTQLIPSFDPRMFGTEEEDEENFVIDPMTGQKFFSGYKKTPKSEKESKKKSEPKAASDKPAPAPLIEGAGFTPDEMIAGSSRAGTFQSMMNDTSGLPLPTKPAEEKTKLDAFLDQLSEGRKDLAEQRKQDKNMALLAAGLGIMGGESPYAFSNIGKGGLAGAQFLSEANKQRAAEKSALDRAQVTAMRYQDLGDIAKGQQAGLLNLRRAELTERQRANSLSAVKAMRDDARAVAIAGLKQQGLLGEDLQNPNVAAKIEDAMQAILSRDPAFLQTYRDAFNVDYGRQAPVQSGTSFRKYDSKGKEIK
jgi:hypothetical protein